MRQAIFYLTYNGITNNTNGIGTQAQTFIGGMLEHRDFFIQRFGAFDVHLLTQVPYVDEWGYSGAIRKSSERAAAALGGRVIYCPYDARGQEFWSPEGWETVSRSATTAILEMCHQYDRILVIANDIPFLNVPLFLEQAKAVAGGYACAIRSIIALYGSSYIHLKGDVNFARLEWERLGLSTPHLYPDVELGMFGLFMHEHFLTMYAADPERVAPYASSLLLESPDFAPQSQQEIVTILEQYGIPLDRKIVFGFGRAVDVKGFDILIRGMAGVKDRAHLVLSVVSAEPNAPILAEYRRLIDENGISATLLEGFTRSLPKALCQWGNTTAVVCPSRGEPLSNVPFEVALWARKSGPVAVCSAREGYLEQIQDGVNGFLFDQDLGSVLARVLDLSESETATMRQNAYQKVIRERDFKINFSETLSHVWK
jgi:glycosyltransferase involved in cell wall biosynthesis